MILLLGNKYKQCDTIALQYHMILVYQYYRNEKMLSY